MGGWKYLIDFQNSDFSTSEAPINSILKTQ